MSERIIRWDHPPYSKNWVTDIAGLGRYYVKREGHTRTWRAYFNGRPTTFYGTVDQVKTMCERAIRAYEMHRRR